MKLLLVFVLYLSPILIQAQARHYIQRDSIYYRLGMEESTPNGLEALYTGWADSIRTALALVDRIYKAQTELGDMEALLGKFTGRTSKDFLKDRLLAALPGRWELTSGKDTMVLNINSLFEVVGTSIKGHLEVPDHRTIILKKVMPTDLTLTLTANAFEGMLNNNKVKLIKNNP